MEVLGKSKFLLTLLGFCLPREEKVWLKRTASVSNIGMASFIIVGGIGGAIMYIREHIDDISLIIQVFYQIVGCSSILGVFITFAPKKYLIHEIFGQVKRLFNESEENYIVYIGNIILSNIIFLQKVNLGQLRYTMKLKKSLIL